MSDGLDDIDRSELDDIDADDLDGIDPSDLDDEDDYDEDDDGRPRRSSWHFRVMLVGTAVYLGWRAYQGIGWLVHHA